MTSLAGKVYGKLKVIREADPPTKIKRWYCICNCGNYCTRSQKYLKSGETTSCGCNIAVANTTHGFSKTPIYKVWNSMLQRCGNTKNAGYANYGGRGITVCDSWSKFENFYSDMGSSYIKGLQLDRTDNDKGYSKDNCRWVTRSENALNCRKGVGASSKYRGVYWSKKASKWMSCLSYDKKQVYLGIFTDELQAARIYDNFVLENNYPHILNFEVCK
tara:strand:+ start:161 stop:811 length:651 start_codon:yes stop_codon:yes gene_type:complete